MPVITPSVASQTITISANAGHNITPATSATESISPSPSATINIDPTNASFDTAINASNASTIIGDIAVQPDINVNVGIGTLTSTPFKLNSFKYTFDGFEISNAESYSPGDIVFFKIGTNDYNSDIEKADTSNLTKGAYNNLWMFISYSNASKDLVLMQKGYFDFTFETATFGTWEVGRTIYLTNLGFLNISPSTFSGHWVRSLGYCVPNKENKKRVWFEPDSTYLKRV
tara:strand:+ start:273 stop:959 length:687 start_codon:yes stop_codon:yes gene_type:complete